jgi:hypothetical protein
MAYSWLAHAKILICVGSLSAFICSMKLVRIFIRFVLVFELMEVERDSFGRGRRKKEKEARALSLTNLPNLTHLS